MWFYRHVAARRFSAYHECCRPVLQAFMKKQDIILRGLPSRSSHKMGLVERNNSVFKSVMTRLEESDSKASAHTLMARASLITYCIKGYKIMSSLQLVRGYSSSLLGVPRHIVDQELLTAHIALESTRDLEKLMRY